MKKSIALLTTLAALSANAASTTSTSTTSASSLLEKLEASPFNMTVLHETGSVKNDKEDPAKINGFSTLNILYTGYKISDKDSVKLETRYTTEKSKDAEFEDTWARMVLSYKRGKILTEAENGIGLSAKAELRYYPELKSRAAGGSDGITRFSLSASKTLGKISLGATLYKALTLHNSRAQANYDSYNYLVLSQTASLTDKLSLSMIQEYLMYDNNGEADDSEALYLTSELGYSINNKLSVWVNAASDNTMAKFDGKIINTDGFVDKLTYGVGFSYSVF